MKEHPYLRLDIYIIPFPFRLQCINSGGKSVLRGVKFTCEISTTLTLIETNDKCNSVNFTWMLPCKVREKRVLSPSTCSPTMHVRYILAAAVPAAQGYKYQTLYPACGDSSLKYLRCLTDIH